MDNFVDDDYSRVLIDLIQDINYSNISNSGKMTLLRKHSEVLIRKILNIGNDHKLTLGDITYALKNSNSSNGLNFSKKTKKSKKTNNSKVAESLDALNDEVKKYLLQQIEIIRPLGNNSTHTEYIDSVTDEEIMMVEDSILNLYSILFINYFLKIQLGINSHTQILFIFSLLPPILRFKTWEFLFEISPKNIEFANRLSLSIIKTYNKNVALEWLETNKEKILKIPYPDKKKIEKYKIYHSVPSSPRTRTAIITLDFESYTNMYDLIKDKILDPRTSINEGGIMYDTFEKAIKNYKEYSSIPRKENYVDVTEMFSLGDFVFLGRKLD